MAVLTLSGLYIYPIKSAAGIAVQTAQLTPRGLQFDRRYMVTNLSGQFMTQRRFPKMALISVASPTTENVLAADQPLTITAPGMPTLTVTPLTERVASTTTLLTVEVWGDRTQAFHLGPEAQQWFSHFLEVPCQLVYMPENATRPAAHGKLGTEKLVSFADAYPYLLISEASLAELNEKLTTPVPMNRFRPNLVIHGCDVPHAEDQWQRIRIGHAIFTVAKACDRCSIPTVDQATGKKASGAQANEPVKTLSTYRAWDKAIWFGQNLIQENSERLGTLHVGDEIEILT